MSTTLVGFPFAGGNRYTLNVLKKALPVGVVIKSPDLPGRCSRMYDPFPESVDAAVEYLCLQLGELLSEPCIFFGHCMGALIGFELIRELRRRGLPLPAHMIICGCNAPSRISHNRLSANNLKESKALLRLFGVHEDLLNNDSFVEMLQSALYADIGLYNKYVYSQSSALDIPFTILIEKDSYISDEDVMAWQEETTRPLEKYLLSGPLLNSVEELTPLFLRLKK